MSLQQRFRNALAQALSAHTTLPTAEIEALLETPRNRQFGDLAFPCFQIAKALKKSPVECAASIAASLSLPEGILSATAQGPFLNFTLDRGAWTAALIDTHSVTSQPPRNQALTVVEYSSPNIAKPFHVGHLRATLIGNCIDRVYRYLGYPTVSINHLGDWGTQFGFVWAGCQLWGTPTDTSVLGLLEIYRKATALKEEQETRGSLNEGEVDVNRMAREYFIDLEAGKPYARKFWEWCADISLKYFQQTYQRLNVSFDNYTGESFYSEMLDDVHQWLRDGGLLTESEGALGVALGDLGFARIMTADGRSLYLTRDIATARYRAQTFDFQEAVYVVGAPQTLHFQQLKEILKRMGEPYADTLIHVPFGHVLGIKTRGEGKFFELNEFLDEAYERALLAYREQVSKRPEGLDEHEVARAVGLSAIVYGNLSRTNTKDVHFDWDSALTLQGDSGPYLLYAYARIAGIAERAKEAGVGTLVGAVPAEAFASDAAFFLAEHVDRFLDALEHTRSEHEPSHLATYALELAKLVSRAYLELKVVGERQDIAAARLALFLRARTVLGDCIELLGMSRIERM